MDRTNVSDYDIFMSIIDDVASDVHNDFIEEGRDEAALQVFKDLWKDKLIKSKVVDPEKNHSFTGKPRQQICPRVSSIAAPEPSCLDFLLNYRIPRLQNASKRAMVTESSKSTPAGQVAMLGQKDSPSDGQFQNIGKNLQNYRLPVNISTRQVINPQTATRPQSSGSTALGNLLNVRLAPPNLGRISSGTKQTGLMNNQPSVGSSSVLGRNAEPRTTRRIGQLDGPSDIEFMDDDDSDDDDFDDEVAESLQLDGNDETESLRKVNEDDEYDDDDDEVHDIDGENAPTLADYEEIFDCENVIICQFDKVNKVGRKFKIDLKSGILLLKGKEHVFGVARGEAHM